MNTLDTATGAWKRATTQADRDTAAVAIEEHIAHDTPEGGDYEYATTELLERRKAEFGPVPMEDLRIDTRDMNATFKILNTAEALDRFRAEAATTSSPRSKTMLATAKALWAADKIDSRTYVDMGNLSLHMENVEARGTGKPTPHHIFYRNISELNLF